jgi:endogenous inhibitor of DNA gyrase (YacG/DUF329 family)
MKSEILKLKCPHCGGKTGKMHSVAIYGVQWEAWDGTPINFTDNSSKHGVDRCCDCGKKVTTLDTVS